MHKSPKISVITPSLNCATFIRTCIESVLVQDYPHFEHIIIDAVSRDGTLEILNNYSHLKWISEPDSGEAEALNKALSIVTGDIVCWLNSDDWYSEGVFKRVAKEYLSLGDRHVLYANTNMVDGSGNLLWVKKNAPVMDLKLLIRWWLNPIHPHQPSMFFPTSVMKEVGPFNQALHFSIDYEYWLRCSVKHKFHYIDQVLSNARLRADAKSTDTEAAQIESHWNVLLPYLQYLEDAEKVDFWSDYYAQRLRRPDQNECTRRPDTCHAREGLCRILLASRRIDSSVARLFPESHDREHVIDLLGSFQAMRKSQETGSSFDKTSSTHCIQGIQKGLSIAGEENRGGNPTQIDLDSEFARSIQALFAEIRPKRIIETGTYRGTGTTAIIASTLRDLGIHDAVFYTIEVNPRNYRDAVHNLTDKGLIDYVTLLNGLSLPRHLLPGYDEIQERYVSNVEYDNVYIDHKAHERSALYYKETHFPYARDDLLDECLKKLDFSPDFVLLDSAGHIGNIEFNYVIGKLKSECYIALDDIYHVKHHKSLLQIHTDPRFELLLSSNEKYGFCIAKFTPLSDNRIPSINNILWVRMDAIGDNILSSAMLEHIRNLYKNAKLTVLVQPHVAEIYSACPFVDNIMTVQKMRFYKDPQYRNAVTLELQSLQADLVLNSVYSREPAMDFLSIAGAAKTRVAFNGDLNNIPAEMRDNANRHYTHLLPSGPAIRREIERHRDFLLGIGIDAPAHLQPIIWTTKEDERFAEEVFETIGFEPEKTVALIAGSLEGKRSYPHYGTAIARICKEKGFSLIALGSKKDSAISRQNFGEIDVQVVNMCGRTTLRQTAAILKRCRLAVGAETGIAHMACAAGIPNVVLLGGGHFGRFMPYTPLTSIACLPLECYGCNWECNYQEAHCVSGLSPAVIAEATIQTIEKTSPKPRVFMQDISLWNPQKGAPKWKPFDKFLSSDIVDITMVGEPLKTTSAMDRQSSHGPCRIR